VLIAVIKKLTHTNALLMHTWDSKWGTRYIMDLLPHTLKTFETAGLHLAR